jgi:hypothetical protein
MQLRDRLVSIDCPAGFGEERRVLVLHDVRDDPGPSFIGIHCVRLFASASNSIGAKFPLRYLCSGNGLLMCLILDKNAVL